MIPERKPLKSVWYCAFGKALGAAARCLYRYKISPQDRENISLLRNHLRHHSAVVYFNHLFLGDGPLVIAFLLDALGDSIRVISAVESRKHYDFRRDPLNASILRLAQALGIRLFPVVQHYDRASYSFAERIRRLRKLVKGARKILRQPGGIIITAPEGTRSPDGKLQKAQSGIAHLDRYGDLVYFLPVALMPKGKFSRGISPGSAFELRTTPPFLTEELLPQIPKGLSLADGMMLRLARLLPPAMRGVYAPFLEDRTF